MHPISSLMKSIFPFYKMIYITYPALSRDNDSGFIKLISVGAEYILRPDIERILTALNFILSVRTTRTNFSHLPEHLPLYGLSF